jgi:hypothetical protein
LTFIASIAKSCLKCIDVENEKKYGFNVRAVSDTTSPALKSVASQNGLKYTIE